jgi:hypothetical protein
MMSSKHATFTKVVEQNMIENIESVEIGGDDYLRDSDQKQEDSEIGFLAEKAFSEFLDENDIQYTHKGGAGEVDFELGNGYTVDVKARKSSTGYRRLVKNKDLTTTDDTDLYFLTVAHKDLNGNVVSIEFVGWCKDEEIEEFGEECTMHGGSDGCRKVEVYEEDLRAPFDFIHLLSH